MFENIPVYGSHEIKKNSKYECCGQYEFNGTRYKLEPIVYSLPNRRGTPARVARWIRLWHQTFSHPASPQAICRLKNPSQSDVDTFDTFLDGAGHYPAAASNALGRTSRNRSVTVGSRSIIPCSLRCLKKVVMHF